tara:strand:- start:256 stop:624 length:369 start_codon:yes stop_codon:yes gene_type:complete
MRNFLLRVFVSFIFSSSAYASTMYCKVDTAYVCTDNGCSEVKSEIFINIDVVRKTYQRGDSKGIDTHNMNVYSSGQYVIAEIPGSAYLKIDASNDLNDLSFFEIVHLGLKTWNNFGKCKANN